MPFVLSLVAGSVSINQDIGLAGLRGIFEPDLLRRYAFGVIYAMALLLVMTRLRDALSLLRISWLYLILVLYFATSVLWSSFPLKVLIGLGHFVGLIATVLAASIAVRDDPPRLFRAVIVGGLSVVVASLITVLVFPTRGIMVVAEKTRWVGLSPSPNILGMASLTTVWASMAMLRHVETPKARLALMGAIGLAALCLYGSNSITSTILALTAVVSMPLLSRLLERNLDRGITLTIIAFVLLILFLFTVYLIAPKLLGWEPFLKAVGRSGTLTGRLDIWNVAYAAIQDRPILGWGFDDLQSFSMKHQMHFSQFHNGYLDLLVRGGWLGLVILVVLVVLAAFRLVRLASLDAKLSAPLLVLLGIVLLHNVTEASLVRSPTAMWLLFTTLVFVLPPFIVWSHPTVIHGSDRYRVT